MRRDGPATGGQHGDREGTPTDDGALAMRVVEYPDAADRCTIYPTAVTDEKRMTHWLSADREAFVPLDRWR